MPPTKRVTPSPLDSVIILVLGCMLALLVMWAASQMNGIVRFSKLPEWLNKIVSSVWTYATGGASSLLLGALRSRRKDPPPNYLLWIMGTSIVICLFVFGVAAIPSHSSPPATALLRFSLQCEKLEHPNLSFFQKDPLYKQAHTIASESDGQYQEYIDFPRDADERFYGRAVRVVSASEKTSSPVSPTELCFKQNPSLPSNNAPLEVSMECSEGKLCFISSYDPGWAKQCEKETGWIDRFELTLTVSADERIQPGWKVPSVETLRNMRDRERMGYTEFSIRSSQLGELKADAVQYLIKANGSPLYVDGWAPANMLKDFSNPFTFSFGLENLDFSGTDNGCENIEVDLSFLQGGRAIKQFAISRKYSALRDADEEEVKSQDGTTFTWGGKYVKPKNEDTSEVITGSVPSLENMKTAKNRIDAAKLSYKGQEVVGVLRPPLNNPSYGVAVGVRQPSGQVRFTFDKTSANNILNWILQLPAQQRSLFRKDTFIYQMRPGESGTGTLKSCSSIAVLKP